MTFLRLLSEEAHQNFTYTCINSVAWYDNSSVRTVGYRPLDSSDIFRDAIYARTPEPDLNDPTVQYQGGGFLMAGIPMTAHKNGK